MAPSTNRDEFFELVLAVASQLPGTWDVERHPHDWNWGGKLTNASSGAILHLDGREDYKTRTVPRMSVRGSLPSDSKGQEVVVLGYGERMPEITINSSKPADKIARDIESRLLPAYLPLLAKAKERLATSSAYQSATDDLCKQVAKIIRVKPDLDDRRVSFYHSPLPLFNESMSEARVSPDEVVLELHLPPQIALEILKLLAEQK
jgi:hypothetical protein